MSVKQVQAIVNGQTYTLTFNSNTGKYEATVTAPNKSSYSQSGHYYGITIKATNGRCWKRDHQRCNRFRNR